MAARPLLLARFRSVCVIAASCAASACDERLLPALEPVPVTAPTTVAPSPTRSGFWVDGPQLRDPCGRPVLLRGVSEMIVWSADRDGVPEFAELRRTGANAVRIVWTSAIPAVELEPALLEAERNQLVAVVELHDGQGDFARLPALLDFWSAPATVQLIEAHRRNVLIEIGSGVGAQVDRATWESAYSAALPRLRAAGLTPPIIIDAPGYGNDHERILESGAAVAAADPARNVMFGVGLWSASLDAAAVRTLFERATSARLPLLVSEFSGYAVENCPTRPFDTRSMLADARRLQIGWFAWSWGAVTNQTCPGFGMTSDGRFDELTGWGADVALTDPNGIANTSFRAAVPPGEACSP